MRSFLTFASLAVLLLCVPSVADETSSPLHRVQRDVRELADATHRGDVDTVLRFTHPRIIAMMGGPAKARAITSMSLQRVASLNMVIESFSYPSPPEFLEGGGRRFAIVRTLQVISAKGQRIESLNFQLGVLDAGSTQWKYVEGSRVNKQNVQALFPGFPQTYDFPPFYRKKL